MPFAWSPAELERGRAFCVRLLDDTQGKRPPELILGFALALAAVVGGSTADPREILVILARFMAQAKRGQKVNQ